MDDLVFPVCAPRLIAGRHPLRTPADLKHHTLLHDSVSPNEEAPSWRNWFELARVTGVDLDRGPGYSDSAMVLQAAIAGQGVALGRRSLVVEDLRAGHLVRPFGPVLPTRFAYYLVCPKMTADRAKVRAFREWLLDEVAHDAGDETWTQVAC